MKGFTSTAKPRRARRLFWFLAVAGACGYAPVRGRVGPSMQVAAVKNDTAQAEVGGIFATELRSELAGRGRLSSEGTSGPELLLEVLALNSLPTAVGSEGAAAYRLDGRFTVKVGDYTDTLGGSEDYLSGVDVLGTEANRRAALRRLARTVAREAVERYDVSEKFAK